MEQQQQRTVLEAVAEFDISSSPLPTAIAISETLIYIGTQSGTLILLSFSLDTLTLSRSVSVTNSSIDSIHALPAIARVLLISDGLLFLLDSVLLQPPIPISFSHRLTCLTPRFSSSSSSSFHVNRSESKTLIHKLKPNSNANGVKSPPTTTTTTTDKESNCLVAVAVGKKLILIEIQGGGGGAMIFKEIQGVEGVKTMVWIDDSIIVGTVNGYTLFSCATGQSASMFDLPDPSTPPYLKYLSKTHQLLLLVDNVGIVVNALGQPMGGSLIFHRGAPHAIAQISSYLLIAVRDGRMDLYHRKRGSCIQSISFAGQGVGPCVVRNEESGNGQIVAAASPSKVICFRVISVEEQIKDLLRKKSFKEAITLVEELECEGEMTKEMLSFVHAQVGFLLLFDLRFEEAVNHFLQSETMQPSEIFPFIMRDPNRWSMLVPKNRYWGLHSPPVPLEDVVDDGLMAIQRAIFLRKAGVETTVSEDFMMNPPSKAALLESAMENIIRYLQVSREKNLSLSVREAVDTLLMYLYRALNRIDDMERLASSENNCLVEELETLLDESGHLRTLAFLYASRGMSSKALAIWRTLARQYSAGLWKDPSAEKDPQGTCSNIMSSQKKTSATEASKLLEESSNQDLVLQHLGWIADVDQELAVQILTSEKRAVQFSPEEVIAAIDPNKVDILQRYLQWLIEDQDSDDTQFHTLYALSLAKSSLEIVEKEYLSQKPDVRLPGEMTVSEVEWCTISRSPVRERLQLFLQSSDLYDPEEVLDLIEESELWVEKAILYRKLGQETLVLQILALKLEDSDAAEQYCAEIGREDAYMQLLDIYLDPQDGKEPMFKAAVRLLHNHGESLDPQKVLETLSLDMPLQLASDTILRMLRARIHHHFQGQIVHSLSRAINLDAKLARLEERSRHVQINDESLCDSCHARLGTKLFAMYPDDTIVCYKCFRRQGESVSVTRQNFKKDVIFKPGWLVNH